MIVKLNKNLSKLIYHCYELDSNLIDKFHECSENGFEYCCNDTIKVLNDSIIIEIYEDNQLVGFFGHKRMPNYEYLSTIFIKPNYRNMKNKYWNLICKYFNQPFYGGLYDKNIPANKFYNKKGEKVLETFCNNLKCNMYYFKGV